MSPISNTSLSSVLGGLVLTVVGTLVALLAGEGVTRLVLPQDIGSIVNIYVQDDALQYKYLPRARARQKSDEFDVEIVTSPLGFRDRNYPVAKPSGSCRALLIGDSFSVGHGVAVEDGYAERLEQGLNEAAASGLGPPWEVINASVSGYHLYHYLRSVELHARRHDVDLVIIGFFLGNDFGAHDASARREIRNGFLGRYERGKPDAERLGMGARMRRWLTPAREWLATHSHLYVLVVRSSFPALARLGLVAGDAVEGIDRYRVAPPPQMEAGFAATGELLARTSAASLAAGAVLQVVVVPEPFQVVAGAWERAVAQSGLAADQLAVDAPNRRLRALLEQQGIDYLDLYDPFRAASDFELYFPKDGHWNAAGHALAARELLPSVAARAGLRCQRTAGVSP